MIPQVFAHASQFMDNLYAMLLKDCRVPDARQFKQLRGIGCAAGNDDRPRRPHLLNCATTSEADTNAAVVLKNKRHCFSTGCNGYIGSLACWIEILGSGADTHSPNHILLRHRDAFLGLTAVVRIVGYAGVNCRFDE